MEPHRCYLPALRPLIGNPGLHALSHITGGGIEENTMRVLPEPCRLDINWESWTRPEIFQILQNRGEVPESEMRKVFNLGIGVIAIVDRQESERIAAEIRNKGEEVYEIGQVIS
jgi:phosphoribosylformylglycinamidine cyclo-ligase